MPQTEKKDVDAVVEDILNEAREKAKEIIRKAEREAEAILSTARIQAEEKKTTELRRAEEEGKALKERRVAEERARARMEFLSEREKIVEEVLQSLLRTLERMGDRQEYRMWLTKALARACSEVGGEHVVLRANRRDLQFLRSKIGELSKKVGKRISIGEPIQTIGGLKVESEDGKTAVDQTLESILSRNRERIRSEIVQLLRG